ncbi:MAG: gliding motility-associated C-terminal domain-containing protein [Flavobacteriaceae bacterium]
MKKTTFLYGFLPLALFFIGQKTTAQQYEHFEVSSGFTADVIANGVGIPLLSSSIGVDGGNWAFLSTDFQLSDPGTTYPNALPASGLINSIAAATPGLSFQLNPYSENNSLRLATSGSNGTLVFDNPMQAFSIFVLGTSGDGAATLSGTITFTDSSTQTFTGTLPDWFNSTALPVAAQGFRRVHRATQAVENPLNNPRLYQWQVDIAEANIGKTIASVTFNKTSTTGIANILAVSANALGDCPYPINLAVESATAAAVDLSWEPLGDETQWEAVVLPQGSPAPASGTVVDETSYSAEGLNPVSPYVLYVRAVCGAGEYSSWSQFTFYTPVSNNDCVSPIELTVNSGVECVESETVSFLGATVSVEAPELCGDNNGGDVWYSFTAEETVHVVQLLNFSNLASFSPIAITLYQGGCDILIPIACSTVNYIMATGLVPDALYLIRVSLNTTTATLSGSFDICVTTPTIPSGGNSLECLINTINSDFENPVISQASGWPTMVHHNTVQGWRTTATDGIIEIWPNTTNIGVVPAYSGNQFIELNANMVSGVYQDFDTPVTTTFNFGFAHRGRQGTDTCGLYAGPPEGPYVLIHTSTAGTSSWVYNTGTYTVPDNQTETRFIFQSISSVGGATVGNFLDAITFTANNGILSDNPVSLNCTDESSSLILAAGVGIWTAHDDNPAPTTISDPTSNTPTITGFSLAGTYRYEWTTLYCSSTLEINFTGSSVAEPVAENVVYCVGQTATALEVAVLEDHTPNWYTEEFGGTPLSEAPIPDTSIAGTTTYYVSQTSILSSCESLRVAVTVTVNEPSPLEGIGFEYEFDEYCISNQTVTPTLSIITPLGGTFSISGGLDINPATGEINLAAMTQGTYTVTYTLAADVENCIAESSGTFELTFTVPQVVETGFSYTTPVCNLEENIFPVLNADFVSGGVFQSTTGLVIDEATGEVSVSLSQSGVYVITYTVAEDLENCIQESSGSFELTITPAEVPQTDFSYITPLCYNDSNVFPVFGSETVSGGTFHSVSGLVVDQNTGEIDVVSSTPGTYTITYAVAEDVANCQAAGQTDFVVTIMPEMVYSLYQQCEGGASWLFVEDDNQAEYVWYDQNGNSLHTGSNSFNITEYLTQNPAVTIPENGLTFSVAVDNGCISVATYTVTSVLCIIPKGISPNGDDINDAFDLTGLGANKVNIYNRYGKLVYDFKGNYTNQWKGQSKNDDELPSGTYYYMLETNSGETFTGWVYINRGL